MIVYENGKYRDTNKIFNKEFNLIPSSFDGEKYAKRLNELNPYQLMKAIVLIPDNTTQAFESLKDDDFSKSQFLNTDVASSNFVGNTYSNGAFSVVVTNHSKSIFTTYFTIEEFEVSESDDLSKMCFDLTTFEDKSGRASKLYTKRHQFNNNDDVNRVTGFLLNQLPLEIQWFAFAVNFHYDELLYMVLNEERDPVEIIQNYLDRHEPHIKRETKRLKRGRSELYLGECVNNPLASVKIEFIHNKMFNTVITTEDNSEIKLLPNKKGE